MPSVHQFVYGGEANYIYGHDGAMCEVPISGAPDDADFTRFGMAHGPEGYRLFCFRNRCKSTIYAFGFDGESYAYGHEMEHSELTLKDAPDDCDFSGFDVLNDGSAWRFYLKRLGSPTELYQFVSEGCEELVYGGSGAMATIPVECFPKDSDKARWFMYNDGTTYVYGTGLCGKNNTFYSGGFDGEKYLAGHCTRGELLIEDIPGDLACTAFSMLHDGEKYRFYYMAL